MRTLSPTRLVLAILAAATAVQPASAQMAPVAPHYFSVPNYANSPLPVISGATVQVGNPLIQRQNATDFGVPVGTLAPQLVVLSPPLPAGLIQSFETFNQTVLGGSPFPSEGNVFQAFVLRPTLVPGEYQVVFDSGLLTVPMPVDPLGEVASFPAPNVAVQPGDLLAFYGQGVPVDIGPAGMDFLYAPAPAAPMQGGMITLGGAAFPLSPATVSYSFGATVMDLAGGPLVGGIRKFIDGLPGLGPTGANNLGQYIPVAVADTTTYPGTDYYEIAVVQYQEQMHTDLPPTKLRGYVQLATPVVPGGQIPLVGTDGLPIRLPDGSQAIGVDRAHYLGPAIVANKDRPVRILFRNLLPIGQAGNLFIPVDTTVMGSGMGPAWMGGAEPDPQNPMCGMIPKPYECFTENRATLHLHGGISPWISDGTPHQWITPAGENTPYPKGVSVKNVPDMPDPGPGAMTFFYTNQQSARLMFYHDHAWGITRLNVYAGEAAAYLIRDPIEASLAPVLPADEIPLVIQDKTFVPSAAQLSVQDPTWDAMRWGGFGQLWVPHVYVPAQNPGDASGVNQFGRWAYGPWFWPPTPIAYPPIANPYYDPMCNPDLQWCEPPLMPGAPFVSMGMEAFNDTPLVNGTVYPTVTLQPKAYRFRILSAANDRFFNLHFYVADATGKEVALNAVEVANALLDTTIFPTPDTVLSPPGPSWIQIGTEGGFLPAPVVIPPQPITWVTDPTVFNAGNVDQHSLLLGPAERADVIVDFSAFAGQTLILYNDAPAAFPARDPRYDYYTGNADLTATGGAPSTLPGYGPNTRTVMQVVIANTAAAPAYDLTALQTAFKAISLGGQGVFETGQHPIVVGQGAYNSAYGTSFMNNGPRAGLAQIFSTTLSFDWLAQGANPPLTMPLTRKAIQDEMGEAFDHDYGRMSGNLGLEAPNPLGGAQILILYPYVNPASEVFDGIELPPGVEVTPISTTTDGTQIWKITHNGVDTHPIHFHLFDVQLINRVGWDGIIRKPDLNELGWKDTVRISPLEDTIVAMRPIIPKLPFGLPDSVRPLNPMMPLGSTAQFLNVDANGNLIVPPITNELTNFGNEYVWHCHILSHEEMDMMRPMAVAVNAVVPSSPVTVFTVNGDQTITLTWLDGTPVNYASLADWGDPANEVGFRIERGIADAGGNVATWTQIGQVLANATTFTDTTAAPGTNYRYRVAAWNAAGETVSMSATASLPVAPPATGVTLTSGLPSPQVQGTAVTFTATGQGSFGYQYRFRISLNGGPFSVVKDWSGFATWTLPATAALGNYYVLAEVRTSSLVYRDAYAFMNYTIKAIPATGVTLSASAPSPHPVGTDVVFTATGQGSSGYEYRFRISYNGGPFSVAKNWSAVNTWTLPGTSALGSYYVLAEVRTSSLVSRDAYAATTYVITLAPATAVTLTASVPSPQPQGTSVIFTAAGQGSSGYQYRFRVSYNGGPFTVASDWSAVDTFTLPGTSVAGWYYVLAEVRTSSMVYRDAYAFMNYWIL